MASATVANLGVGALVAETDVLGRVLSVRMTRPGGTRGTLTAEVRDSTGDLIDSLLATATGLLPGIVLMPLGRLPRIEDLQVTIAHGED